MVHDFPPRLAQASLVGQVLAERGRWFAPPLQAYIPLEFADAAFRYGHGQIQHTYQLVDSGPAAPLFPRPGRRAARCPPTTGARSSPRIFNVPGQPARAGRQMPRSRVAASLIGLPEQVTGTVDTAAYHCLAVRDLMCGETTGLPSGEAVARHVGVAR